MLKIHSVSFVSENRDGSRPNVSAFDTLEAAEAAVRDIPHRWDFVSVNLEGPRTGPRFKKIGEFLVWALHTRLGL